MRENGFGEPSEPILKPLQTIRQMDAILAYDEAGRVVEPVWPEAEVVIGNPPFLGASKIWSELGQKYKDDLFSLYGDRLPASDLVCYWFERTRALLESNKVRRAGLLATNSIRGGANRRVLERIKKTGDIFMAWSNRPWILEGAAVRVSMIGFDNGSENERVFDGKVITTINANLTGEFDLTRAQRLQENLNISFSGTKKGGPFDVSYEQAQKFLQALGNPNGRPNSDVVKPWVNGTSLVKRPQDKWIIDFGVAMSESDASLYEQPFEYVKQNVYPRRMKNKRASRRENWWLHSETAPAMRMAIAGLFRYIATPRISKYRLFMWVSPETIPDDGIYIFARDDDYFFGILHSTPHELWALRLGTSLEDRPRYTPTTTFDTFPFPYPPGHEPTNDPHVEASAQAARELVEFRQAWLHPEGVGITISEKQVKKRTLTNLYNALTHYRENIKGKQRSPDQWKKDVGGIISLDEIEELDHIHTDLDQAVLEAYGWPHSLTDEQILEQLLALNQERAAEEARSGQ